MAESGVDATAAYRQFGVDLDLGNDASDYMFQAALQTHANRADLFGEPEMDEEVFHGVRSIDFSRIPDVSAIRFNESADGIGTKIEFAERLQKFDTLGHDLFAMACDDLAAQGGEPAWITTIFDVNKLNDETMPHVYAAAVGSIASAAAANVAIFTGETAELGDRVNGYGDGLNINWNGVASGAFHRERVITGEKVKAGDVLVGVHDPGFGSNGASAIRRIFEGAYGYEEWHEYIHEGGKTLGELALQPCVIYSGLLVKATGGYDPNRPELVKLHGVAHITGGGMPEKVGRMLHASGLGADIEEPFEQPEIQRIAQEKAVIRDDDGTERDMTDEEALSTWHGGQRLIVATPEPAKFMTLAATMGMEAKEVGEVVKKPGVRIKSNALRKPGEWLNFSKAA